jgi:hypothetical protein
MPARPAIYHWLRDDPEFAEEYALAREQAADVVDEQIAALTRETTSQNAAAMRVRIASLQWRAGKLNPFRYGGSASTISVETNAIAVGGEAELAAAKAHLVSELDAISERLEAADRADFWVSRMVNDALRKFEAKRRLDPFADLDEICAVVRAALMPTTALADSASLPELVEAE